MKNWMKQSKKKLLKKRSALTICLYILSILFIGCFVYMFYDACQYIGNLMVQGQINLGSSFGKIVRYMMDNTGSFLVFGISFGIYGKMITYIKKDKHLIGNEEVEDILDNLK